MVTFREAVEELYEQFSQRVTTGEFNPDEAIELLWLSTRLSTSIAAMILRWAEDVHEEKRPQTLRELLDEAKKNS